ncbi:hypothetical protein Syun_021680 [Stephania yunnanensis]|uniref:Cytochrome P450 n=1 Tax=Stephania yunnanensis TaxID=152371 RepID=A0AAP0IG75_9MAGN
MVIISKNNTTTTTTTTMAANSWIIALASTAFITAVMIIIMRIKKHKRALPPGPRGLPILGNLHMLGDLPHQDLHKLSQKYGPIMHIRLGLVPTIVVSSPKAAELFLKTHDLVFSGRPSIQGSKYISYGRKGLAFAGYGSYWREIRKLCTLELFTSAKIEMFRPMRREEVGGLVEVVVKGAAEDRRAVCVSEMVEKVVEDMTYRMVFGGKDDRFHFRPIINEVLAFAGGFNVGDYVPFLAPFDVQGLLPRMKAASKNFDEVVEKIIEEHIKDAKEQNGQVRDFIDVMLSLMESNSMKQVQFVNVVNWAFAELLRHPKLMKRVQDELRDVVGMDRMVEETNLPKLNYLNMVIKETMRLHPVVPLLIPHESTEDITINGYFLPKKSRVIVNVWTIGRDPNAWSEDAEEFNPDRFIGIDIDFVGSHEFQLIPFGSGRRSCPGMQLGLVEVQLILAQLLHCFNWELPDGASPSDLDMSEKFNLTMARASSLHCIPSYRLNNLKTSKTT